MPYDVPPQAEEDDNEPPREAPDVSHVTPAPADLPAARDEALDELARRLDVMATRADRLERSVEKLSPVHMADMPTRADLRAMETLANANNDRAQLLEALLIETRDAGAAADQARSADRASAAEMASSVARLEGKLRDVTEELQEARAARATATESLRELRQAWLDHDAARAADVSRRLAGAYVVAFVALLAALLTLVLLIAR